MPPKKPAAPSPAVPTIASKITFDQTPDFKASLIKFAKNDSKVLERFERFKDLISQPPYVATALKDHKLSGRLLGLRDVHLAADVVLIFSLRNGVVNLIEVVNHHEIEGAREKANAKRWPIP